MQSYVGPASLLALLLGGLRLDLATYRRVSLDAAATHQCIAVALLGAIALGFDVAGPLGFTPTLMIAFEMVRALAVLVADAFVVWILGWIFLRRRGGFATVLRPIALAGAPGVLFVILAVLRTAAPAAVAPGGFAVSVWLLAAFAVAIRAALDCGLGLAAALAVAVWAIEKGMYALAEQL